MSAIEHMKAALERFKAEDMPKKSITGSLERSGSDSDGEGGHHPEYPSRSPEQSTDANSSG